MPSTYTLNNGIELIGTGEQSGTWGDTTNTNFELLDTALDGQVSVTLAATGSSGSPNTLPISDGASSNGRNRLVIFGDGGDLGGTAFVQLTPNDAEKIIYVRNNLSGSRSILLFQGTYNASNDYEVPAGTTAVVFFNGAGSGAVAANVFNNAFFDSLRLGSVSVTAILDEDNMASNSATALSTQQSIKAYVDSQVGTVDTLAEILANGNTTGGNDIVFSAGDNITNASGDLTLDVAGDIILDADGGDFKFRDGGAGFFTISNSSLDAVLKVEQSNEDFIIKGNDGGSEITALTLDMSEAGRAIFNAGLLSNDTNDIRKAQITTQFDSSSFLRLHPSATTDSGGYTNMFFGTSTDNNYGVAIGGLRAGSDNTPSFRIRTHNDSINGVDVLTINNSGVSTFRSGAVFNENGDDADFRVESDNTSTMLFVDAGNDRVGINNASPSYTLDVGGDGIRQIQTGGGLIAKIRASTNNNTDMIMSARTTDSNGTRTGIVANGYPDASYAETIGRDDADFSAIGWTFYTLNSTYEGQTNAVLIQENTSGTETRLIRASNDGGIIFNEDSVSSQDFRVESDSNANMLFVDAGSDHVSIGTGEDRGGVLNVESSDNNYTVMLSCTDDDNNAGPWLGFDRRTGSAANNDNIGSIAFLGRNSAAEQVTYSEIRNYIDDVTDGTEDGIMQINVLTGGSTVEYLRMAGGFGSIFNEGGADVDFRVESDANTHMLFVDAGNNVVGVNTSENQSVFALNVLGTGVSGGRAVKIKGPDTNTSTGTSAPQLVIANSNSTTNNFSVLSFAASGDGTTAFIGAQTTDHSNSYGDLYIATRGPTNGYRNKVFIGDASMVINEDSADYDFRVESNSNSNMLFVDAGSNVLGVGTDAPTGFVGIRTPAVNYSSGVFNKPHIALQAEGDPDNDDGFVGITYATSSSDNYGWSGGAERRSGGVGEFVLTYHSNSATGTERTRWNLDGFIIQQTGAVFNESGGANDFRVESDGNANAFFVDAQYSRIGINNGSPSWAFDAQAGVAGQVGTFYDSGSNGGSMYNGAAVLSVSRRSNGSTSLNGELFRVGRDNSDSSSYNVSESIFTVRSDSIVVNESGTSNIDFRVESDSNANAFFVDATEDNVLMGRSSPQSYDNTATTINVEATGSFSTSAVTATSVGTTYVNSGWTFGNNRQVWLITLVGNNTTSNAHSTVAYIATVGAYSKTLTQLGSASDHYGNGYLSAQVDSSSAASVNLQVRWNSLYAGGTSDVVVQGLRLL